MVLFIFGKVNFVHWCVLGLTCIQQTFVTMRNNHAKETLVDKVGVTVRKRALLKNTEQDFPRRSEFQEDRKGP